MNLIDAIKSGRPFRRPSWPSVRYDQNHWVTTVCRLWDEDTDANIREDILAEDWQIQEPTVTITRAQFWESILAAKKECEVVYGRDVGRMLQTAARKLGLEDIGTPGGHGFDNRGVCKCGHRTSDDPERCKLGLEDK